MMNISSRTPEGIPNRCPVCGKKLVLKPSGSAGDTRCSHCGHLLWFKDKEANEVLTVKLGPWRKMADMLEEVDRTGMELQRLAEEVLGKTVSLRVVLDFSGVAFLSSGALGKLLTLDDQLKAAGGQLKLCNVRPEIYELFAISRLDWLIYITEA